jgi:steroid Delta-isomerase
MTSDGRVERHVAAFNAAVASGDWSGFAARFTLDAQLAFEGVPAGPFRSRETIAAAYENQPPTDTMRALDVDTDGTADTVRFAWTRGGTGTMRLTWEGDLVASLVVAFDG